MSLFNEKGYPYMDANERALAIASASGRGGQGKIRGGQGGGRGGQGGPPIYGTGQWGGIGQGLGQEFRRPGRDEKAETIDEQKKRRQRIIDLAELANSEKSRQCYENLYPNTFINLEAGYFRDPQRQLLTSKQKKFCRCLLHAGCKQTDDCLTGTNLSEFVAKTKDGRDIQSFKDSKGNVCYNIYPLCTKSTKSGLGNQSCLGYYNFNRDTSQIPVGELYALVLREQFRIVKAVDEHNKTAQGNAKIRVPYQIPMWNKTDPKLRVKLLNILNVLQRWIETKPARAADENLY